MKGSYIRGASWAVQDGVGLPCAFRPQTLCCVTKCLESPCWERNVCWMEREGAPQTPRGSGARVVGGHNAKGGSLQRRVHCQVPGAQGAGLGFAREARQSAIPAVRTYMWERTRASLTCMIIILQLNLILSNVNVMESKSMWQNYIR